MPREAGFLVFLRLEPGDLAALTPAFGLVFDDEEYRVDTTEEGSTDLTLALVARSLPDAKAFAESLWEEVRSAAALPHTPADVRAISRHELLTREARHVELRKTADVLLGEEKYGLAIIVAQTACELFSRT